MTTRKLLERLLLVLMLTSLVLGGSMPALAGDYDGALTPQPATVTCEGLSASCTGSRIAADDMNAWSEMLERLPGGMASVERIPVAGKGVLVRVNLCWNEERRVSADNCASSGDASDRLKRYALEVML